MNRAKLIALTAAAAVGSMVSPLAQAAVDAGVSTALADAKTDTATVALAAFVVIMGIVVFKWFRRAV
jgi:hypothetical protein